MIVVIGNQKGGVGKSTLTVNLATAWQVQGKHVVIVEADPSVFTVSRWSDDREEAGLTPILTIKKTGRLAEALRNLNDQYDMVIVDLPGKDSPEMRSALIVADVFLLPTQPSQADIDATIDLKTSVLADYIDINPAMKVLVVLNRAATHAWNTESTEARNVLQNDFDTILHTVIHERKAYRSTLSTGSGVIEGDDVKAATEITNLAHEITSST